MKIKTAILLLCCIFLFTGCNGNAQESSSPPAFATNTLQSEIPILTKTATITATATSTITPIPWNSPTPVVLYGYPTPQNFEQMESWLNPLDGPPMDVNDFQREEIVFHELYVGKYVLRKSCLDIMQTCGVTISSKGQQQTEIIGYPAVIGEETGADLTGTGNPNIVIINNSGGNCCVGTLIYEAGDMLKQILDAPNFRSGYFIDFYDDGVYEYIAYDRLSSQFCTECGYNVLPIIYEYKGSSGYIAATDKYFPMLPNDVYLQMEGNLERVSEFRKNHPDVELMFDNKTVDSSEYCSTITTFYRLVAYYLLLGEEDEALEVLNEFSSPERSQEFLSAIHIEVDYLMTP